MPKFQKGIMRSLRGQSLRNANGDIDQSSYGYQIAIDTLTYLRKEVIGQKFYEVPPADFIPISVGEGAFAQNILQNFTFSESGDFEEGVINQGSANAQLAAVDAGISSKTIKIATWAKAVTYTLIEIEQALQANNWDIIEQRYAARKKNWDLGIQMIAFLGSLNDTGVPGLLTQSQVNSNLTVITKKINAMTSAEFSAFVAAVLGAYLSNCNNTALPNMFAIPLSDYIGLAAPVSDTNPYNSKLEYLKNAFKEVVPGGVEIKGVAYCDAANNASRGVNKNRYVLYRKNPEAIRMDIPVDFQMTQPNSLNNFQFQNAAFGQYSGCNAYRVLETLYFDF